jgi:hypothetical protein
MRGIALLEPNMDCPAINWQGVQINCGPGIAEFCRSPADPRQFGPIWR